MSTFTFKQCRQALKGKLNTLPEEPFHDGDPFNVIQSFYPELQDKLCNTNDEDFNKYEKILDRYSNDYLLRMGSQPYMISKYSDLTKKYNVIYLKRELSDVVYSLYKKNWYWLTKYSNSEKTLEGLAKACYEVDALYQSLTEHKLHYLNIVKDENTIPNLLRRVGYKSNKLNYRNDAFVNYSKVVLDRRKSDLWHEINELINGFES